MKKDYAASPAWLKTLMNAWADGLNYFIATHPNVLPRVLTHFEPWMALTLFLFGDQALSCTVQPTPKRSTHIPNSSPHICFSIGTVTFAPADAPKVAVAVLVEQTGVDRSTLAQMTADSGAAMGFSDIDGTLTTSDSGFPAGL